jgi:hypothetical protein
MKMRLLFLLLLLGLGARAANPAFTDFFGTNGVVISTNGNKVRIDGFNLTNGLAVSAGSTLWLTQNTNIASQARVSLWPGSSITIYATNNTASNRVDYVINSTNRGLMLIQDSMLAGTNGAIVFGDGVNAFFFTNRNVQVQENSFLMQSVGSVASFKGVPIQVISNTSLSIGKDLNDATTNRIFFSTNSYIVDNGGATDTSEINRYRLANNIAGWHSNDIARMWELTNGVRAYLNGALLTNISVRSGLALPTLTINKALVLDGFNNVTNPSGTADSTTFLRGDNVYAVPSGSSSTPFTTYTSDTGTPKTNIIIDASLGILFRVVLTNNMGLLITNGTDGQELGIELYQDGVGNRTVTHVPNTAGQRTNNWNFGQDITSPILLTTNQYQMDMIKLRFLDTSVATNACRSNWLVIGTLHKFSQ